MGIEYVDQRYHIAQQFTVPATLSSPSLFSSENIKCLHLLSIQFINCDISLVMGQVKDNLWILAFCVSLLFFLNVLLFVFVLGSIVHSCEFVVILMFIVLIFFFFLDKSL